MMDYGMGWGFGGFAMVLFWIVPLVLLLVGIKYLFSSGGFAPGGVSSEPSHSSRALATLEERYARGEIDRDEFLQKRGDIHGK